MILFGAAKHTPPHRSENRSLYQELAVAFSVQTSTDVTYYSSGYFAAIIEDGALEVLDQNRACTRRYEARSWTILTPRVSASRRVPSPPQIPVLQPFRSSEPHPLGAADQLSTGIAGMKEYAL